MQKVKNPQRALADLRKIRGFASRMLEYEGFTD
jgi:hypothetical protein